MRRATTSIAIGLALLTTCTAIAGAAAPRANLAPTKAYLLQHTTLLQGFTRDFQKLGARYHAFAQETNFDYARLWSTHRAEVAPLLRKAKSAWIEGNPYYERAEGVVAGTPSLAVYDVILDAARARRRIRPAPCRST